MAGVESSTTASASSSVRTTISPMARLLAVVDHWNQTKRFASAYLDDEDDPFLQMDVNTEGGIAQANFEKKTSSCGKR